MKSAKRWKIFVGVGLAYLAIACAPKRNETQFSKNKEAESGQIYSPDQMRAALGADRYDALVAGIGQDNLNLLTYGIGISNMAQLINGITGPGKLTALMSDGPNSKKLNVIEVLDLLNKLDDACQRPGSFGTDTIAKMVNMINVVSVAGMEGVKNIVHGLQDQPLDLNGGLYQNNVSRLGYLISLLNESMSVMPTLVNDLAAPSCSLPHLNTSGTCTGGGGTWTAGGVFSSSGNYKLIRLVNETLDMRDLSSIINATSSISNMTQVLNGLTGNMYCSKAWYNTQSLCTSNGGTWTNTNCSNPVYSTRSTCTGGGATWTPDGVENMLRVVNEVTRTCSLGGGYNGSTCISGGGTWTTKATALATIINGLTVVPNAYIILNNLTNDGKKPGDLGNVTDGTDAMVATLNNTTDITKMTYVINGLNALTPDVSNDDDFESASASCAANTRTELAKFNYGVNKMVSGANIGLKSWFVKNATGASGNCAAQTDPTLGHNEIAVMEYTANITTAGTASFKYKVSSESPSSVKTVKVLTGGTLYTSAPTVAFSGGGGTGAAATATVAAGSVGTLTLLTPGSNYTSNPTVSFSGGGGSGAAAVANRTDVGISSITLNNGGNYELPPTIDLNSNGSGGVATANMPTAGVQSFVVTGFGANYTSAPTCSLSGGGGTGAGCSTTLGKVIASVTKNTNGSDCPSGLTASVTGGSGSGGAVSLTMASYDCSCVVWICSTCYRLNTISLTNAGVDYETTPSITFGGGCSTTPTATATLAATGRVKRVNLTAAGSGYSSRPAVTISGGGGSGASATSRLVPRAISSITLNTPGSYTAAPSVVFTQVNGDIGSGGAVATANVPASAIESLTLTNGGSGYTTNPTVTISGGGGSGATASASVDPMSVIKITLTSAGTGYTSAPTVTLTGGGGSGATAQAFVSGDYLKFYVDDVLKMVTYGTPASFATFTTASLPVGIHRLRWEYVKDDANSAGTNQAFIDDIALPGNRGVSWLGAEKVAILMNKLYINSINNVADIMNGTTTTPGLDNLVAIINQAEFPPGTISSPSYPMPSLVAIVNNLTNITTLTDMLNTLNTTVGVKNMVEIVDHVGQGDKLASLVANLSGGSPGIKMTNIINSLDSQGTSALIRSMDQLGAAYPLVAGDDLNEMITLINGITNTAHVPTIINELSLAGSQSTVLNSNSSPTGGQKLGLVLQAVKTKSIATGENATCNSNTSSFCTKNHLVRLMNDIANSGSGPSSVGKIVTALDANALVIPGTSRMVEVLYAVKNMNATLYTNALSNSGAGIPTSDQFGRLTTLIGDMGVSGAPNVARLVNEVNNTYLGSRVAYLVTDVARIKYLSRLITEMTNVDLVITLLNNASTNIIKVRDLLDRQGNLAYGTAALGVTPGTLYTDAMSTSTVDGLGRLIVLINEVSGSGVNNIVTVINSTYDLDFISSPTATFSYGSRSDGTGNGMLNAITRIRYLSNLMNGVANINLMINIINGQSGNMTNGIKYSEMVYLLNNVGGSTRKGVNTKSVGDVSIVAEVINALGWNTATNNFRSISEQMRIVTVVNNAIYCGVRPQYDRDGDPGNPTSEYYPCDTTVSYAYNKNSDAYDQRHRVSNFMLGMTTANAAAITVGNVTDTNKTVATLNGIRRINLLIKTVDWMPGEVTADLMNYTNLSRISTGLVYLANNLDPDEDVAAQAFTSMIHWGTGIPAGGTRTGACTYFTAIGPKRLGGVLNTETGQYLEGIIQMFGWRTAIPALVCGLGAHVSWGGWDVGPSTYTSGTSADGTACSTGSSSCQRISGAVGTSYFKYRESVAIVNNPTVGSRNGTNYTHYYQANSQANCENYYPEQSGAMGFNRDTDQIVSRGFEPIWGISVEAGIGGVWDTLKGAGIIGWMLQNGGNLGTPPLVSTGNTIRCTDGSSGDEWSCIKQGKDVSPNLSYYRWGNYCSIPGYTTYSTCEGAGGRWMPNKNYAACNLNPSVDQPRE